jgi:hypothetical protein
MKSCGDQLNSSYFNWQSERMRIFWPNFFFKFLSEIECPLCTRSGDRNESGLDKTVSLKINELLPEYFHEFPILNSDFN